MEQLRFDRLPRTVELLNVGGNLAFRYIDQRLLPEELRLVDTSDWREVVTAIKTLAVRGAPAIGLAGASAIALWADRGHADVVGTGGESSLAQVAEAVGSARPTAVNLRWAVERIVRTATQATASNGRANTAKLLYDEVKRMEAEDETACRSIGTNGAALLPRHCRVLTHCNAGSLAVSYFGTALGVVYAAAEQGKIERVYADETRPVGQGARLTAWELSRVGVPTTLICDNMAASLMASGQVDAVVVGADRIARNCDTANKIGTYGVAVLAHEHGIPFYVAAPTNTLDLSLETGAEIPIEQRDPSEVLQNPLPGVDVWNPAFDVTPARYITAIISEKGVHDPSRGLERV